MKRKIKFRFRLVEALALPLAFDQVPDGLWITCFCFRLGIYLDKEWPEGVSVGKGSPVPLQGTPVADLFNSDSDDQVHVLFPAFGVDYHLDKKMLAQISPGVNPEMLLAAFHGIERGGSDSMEIGRIEMNEGALIISAKVELLKSETPDDVLDQQEFSDVD